MTNFVIGAGIAGLIKLYYGDNDTYIISENIGGQLYSDFDLGPRLLKKSKSTEGLLKELGLSTTTREIRVGYLTKEGLCENPSISDRQDYFEKTRFSRDFSKSSMSDGESKFEAYNVTMAELMQKLFSKIDDKKLVDGRALKIDVNQKSMSFSTKKNSLLVNVYFDRMFSTIPLPFLFGLIEKTGLMNFRYIPTFFHLITGDLKYDDKFDYIYVTDKSIPYHRITKKGNRKFIIESTKEIRISSDFTVDKIVSMKMGQIINNLGLDNILIGGDFKDEIDEKTFVIIDNNKIPVKIELIGRYAQWKHSIRTQEVIERCQV